MPIRDRTAALIAASLLATLAACRNQPDAGTPDTASTNAGNPVSAGPLAKLIVVDPARFGQVGEAGPLGRSTEPCPVRYDKAWASKLPAELPLYPGARLTDAAGSDVAGCKRRIVSFTSTAPVASIIAYYGARARTAGYSLEHLFQDGADVLGGTRGESAYFITVAPAKDKGSAVDIIATTGG